MIVALAAIALSTSGALPPVNVRGMIRDVRQIVARSGDRVWRGYSRTSIPLLLVEPTRETLFCSPPLQGFTASGVDPVTGCDLQTRPRETPIDISATTDVEGRPTIQIGLPDAFGWSRGQWIVTVLHESFHEFQSTLPGYDKAVDRARRQLGKGGGEWMLDYPFPYAKRDVVTAFGRMDASALAFLEAPPDQDVGRLVADYVDARRAARAIVGTKDWRYYEVQVGQEGVALWTELTLAKIAGDSDREIAAVAEDRQGGLATSLRSIAKQGLGKWRRGSFYIFGAIEAKMLERVRPDWQDTYRQSPLSVGAQLDAAVRSMRWRHRPPLKAPAHSR